MRLVYMAHPVAPEVGETIESNLESAKAHLRFLLDLHGDNHCIIAPWITEVEIFGDSEPGARERGIARCVAIIERCDSLWLVGPRISSGMSQEQDRANSCGIGVRNMIGMSLD